MQKRCDAKTKTRNGGRCKNYPVLNGSGRCRMHGGKTLRGSASPVFKHGLYSKYVKGDLKEIISKLDQIPSDDLIDPVDEIKLFQALVISSKAVQNGAQDLDELSSISSVLHRLIASKQRSQKVLIEQDQLIAVSDILKFLDWMETLLIQHVGADEAYKLIGKMKTFKLTDQ